VIEDFFWLHVAAPKKGQSIDARVQNNKVEITTRGVKEFTLGLDGRLVDVGRPLRVTLNGKEQVVKLRPALRTLCRSMARRGDPQLAFTCRVGLKVEEK
jgi:hypothetical protein